MGLSTLYRQQNLRTRLILAFMLTVLIPLVGTSLYGNWITSQVLQSQAVEAAQADLRVRRLQMEDRLQGSEENLLFLSQMISMESLLNGRSPENLVRVQVDFADYVATHPDIFQARYLDKNGMEIVRIDASPDDFAVAPPSALQNKMDRYYFRQTMALPAGAVFISPIDLNREFGQIQEPHTPTLRYATPVFDDDGTRSGIVILNLFAEPLLQFARGETLALTDEAGFFLLHADPELEWGGPADLNSGISDRTVCPDSWQAIRQADEGIILPQPENSWQAAWEFLNPLVARDDGRRVLVFDTIKAGDNQWRLINDLPRATLLASVGDFRVTAVFIVIGAMILAAGMALLFARQIGRPVQQLTIAARQFGKAHGAVLPQREVHAAPTHYEIDELAAAFQDMTTALERQMDQLSQLNFAGHHIAARLEQSEVITAVSTAVHRLLPVEYLVITLNGVVLHQDGPAEWAAYRDHDLPDEVLQQALADGNWTTMAISRADQPAGYLCCAPISVEEDLGLIELYGRDPILSSQAAGELLGTLAVQVSISLENAQLVHRLAGRRAELQVLLEQLLNAQEEERRRIAYDIHDGLIQMLVGSRLQFANFMAECSEQPEQVTLTLQKGIEGLGDAIVETRRVIEGLRPAALDDLGLEATVRYVAETACAETGCALNFTAELADERLPSAIETTAFRIVQEAITNAQKYAAMRHLTVQLVQENGTLMLAVIDDGRGFDPAEVRTTREGGFGLRSMQERARLVGGDCVIENGSEGGTAVVARLPVRSGE